MFNWLHLKIRDLKTKYWTFEPTALSEEGLAFRSFENEHSSRSWRQLRRLIMTKTTCSSSALNLERPFFLADKRGLQWKQNKLLLKMTWNIWKKKCTAFKIDVFFLRSIWVFAFDDFWHIFQDVDLRNPPSRCLYVLYERSVIWKQLWCCQCSQLRYISDV